MLAQLQAQAMYLKSLAAATRKADSGNDRVFISDMYDHMVSLGEDEGTSLAEFKALLLQCKAARLVRLTRCDLVRLYDEVTVRRSETVYMEAEFHFVAV